MLMKLFRCTWSKPLQKGIFPVLAFLPAGGLLGAKPLENRKVNQVFSAPQTMSLNGQKVAQVLRKEPSLASSTSNETTGTISGRTSIYNSTLSAQSPLTDSISTATLYEAPSTFSTTLDPLSPPGGVTITTTNSAQLEDLLLSLPSAATTAYSTTDSLSSYLDNAVADIVNLDTTSTVEGGIVENILPEHPLPLEELERLTTASRAARRITLMAAVCQALEVNQALQIEKLRPEIVNTEIEAAEGEFDTVLESGVNYSVSRRSTLGARSREAPDAPSIEETIVSRDLNANIGVRGRLPTGTDYGLTFETNRNSTNRTFPFYTSGLNLNITQNLLRGAGCDVNLIRVWNAKNNFVISLYQLQQNLINLVTDVQLTYWEVYLAIETLEIQKTAYRVAREQRLRAEEFVRVGRSAPLEALAAQAEEASRISQVIVAAADLKRRQLDFLRLINPDCIATGWRSLIFPSEVPVLPSETLVPEERVRLARVYRPDLRQAQIDLANGELEVVRTENGLLPQLDFVTNYSLAGSGDSLGDTRRKVTNRDFPSYALGIQFSYPLQNRQANAAYRRANFQRRLAEESIRNFCQLIEVEVRSAIIEIERTDRLIESTRVTEVLRQRELEAEVEKFRVGRSTQVSVNQVQRDLVQAQLDRVTAEVAHINAYLQLYRAEGTALQRRGIEPICITPESGVP